MHRFGDQSLQLALAMMAVCISTASAHAYLDPGTGSIILQVLLGGFAGLILAIKLYWHKFLSLSGLGGRRQESDRLARKQNAGHDEPSRS
jgi:hypothetical protein